MNNYTKGGEYGLQDGRQYIGYYHKVNGKYYTGIKHVYSVSKRIYKILKKDKNYTEDGLRYKSIIEKHYFNNKPLQLMTVPSKNQYLDSFTTIYILMDVNTKQIYEVTEKCYKNFNQSKKYKTFKIYRKNGLSDIDTIYNKTQLKLVKNKLVQNYLFKYRGF